MSAHPEPIARGSILNGSDTLVRGTFIVFKRRVLLGMRLTRVAQMGGSSICETISSVSKSVRQVAARRWAARQPVHALELGLLILHDG
jgi:hypothetical protein